MSVAGQQALLAYINGGGRLVTSEWTLWKARGAGKLHDSGAGVFVGAEFDRTAP